MFHGHGLGNPLKADGCGQAGLKLGEGISHYSLAVVVRVCSG